MPPTTYFGAPTVRLPGTYVPPPPTPPPAAAGHPWTDSHFRSWFRPSRVDLELWAGDWQTFDVQVNALDGTSIALPEQAVFTAVCAFLDSPGGTILGRVLEAQAYTDAPGYAPSGILRTDTPGLAQVQLVAADTQPLPAGFAYYEVEIEGADFAAITVQYGNVFVHPDSAVHP
jgi:hypothetical protein